MKQILSLLAALSTMASIAAGQGFSPEEAVRRMHVPEGLEVKLVLAEPDVRQPVTMTFDDRGRLWVIQYLQYPTPAGLKPVKVDQYLRTTYDKLPEPPPHGPKGADKITIYEDNGTGRFRRVKDFVTGLNLASGMALGYDGLFVVQPPYLLFYPDRNHDDVPDSEPEVLLTGFGMEDAHAFANSLQWGPDGWLYGAQGSTVTAHIRGISFQQGIWRYHPVTKEFELFSEGGGNTWGLDFDRHGNVIAGTNYGNSAMLHQVQGAYYVKGFAKHGELQNPHAYGYFEHVPYKGFKGGHVTCGGVLYGGGAFPKKFDNVYIAANPLSNALYWHILEPKGSSFTARHGGDFLIANDTWFRPVDCLVGPDGALYVADWYDVRINHVDPVDNWDRTNGRIYKVQAKGAKPAGKLALGKMSTFELVNLLKHDNDWYAREALRILGERRDSSEWPTLREWMQRWKGELGLRALWALYVTGRFDSEVMVHARMNSDEDIRSWAVRLLGDSRKVSPLGASQFLAHLARQETSPVVRSQLACTAKRLPGPDAIPIIRELLRHSEDVNDVHIPLLIWWAIEDKAVSDRELVLSLLDSSVAWQLPLMRQFILERLARRYMAGGSEQDLLTCALLLNKAPTPGEVALLIQGMEKALQGRRLVVAPAALQQVIGVLLDRTSVTDTLVKLGMRLGLPSAFDQAMKRIGSARSSVQERTGLIEVLAQLGQPANLPLFLKLFETSEPSPIRQAALNGLQASQDPAAPQAIVQAYPKLPADLRSRARAALLARPLGTKALLQAVDQGKIAPQEIPDDQLRLVALHHDAAFDQLVAKHWGKVTAADSGEKIARIRSVLHMLGQGKGDPVNGHALFVKHCASCHVLFGEGTQIGPELTGADRRDRNFLATSIVDPSAVIRKEYVCQVATTRDGRILTGLLAESTPQTITLVDAKNVRTTIARQDLDELQPSAQSLMPERLLDPLTDQDIRDFFSYLQSAGPPQPKAVAPRAQADQKAPLKICLVSGALEYDSDQSLAKLQEFLEKHYHVQCSRAFRKTDTDLPGLENLDTCDVMVLYTRRLKISGEQLERVKQYCQSGKPIVAIRTASHAFQNWLALDAEVFGGSYGNHYSNKEVCDVRIVEKAKDHPILKGVTPFESPGSLYKNPKNSKDVEVLLTGSIPGHTEPVAWTRPYKGGRVFYTSIGHQKDFDNPNYLQMLANALFWTTNRTPPK